MQNHGAHMPSIANSSIFVMTQQWQDRPMAYRVEELNARVWDSVANRKAIWDHCPELKMVLDMKLEVERC